MKNIGRKLLFVLVLCCSVVTLSAQSAAEIELAKKLARQKGYSESEINAMMNKFGGNSNDKNSTVSTTTVVDRNAKENGTDLKTKEGANPFADFMGEMDLEKMNREKRGINELFGHSIFKNKQASFIPSYNIPTPESYRLSAGDEVIIDIWGAVVTNMTLKISPEGSIRIPDLGPVYVGGQTVASAEQNLKDYLSKIYSGINEPTPTTFVKLSLGSIRSVTVNVLGDLTMPGTYTMPSLSTIASALYMAQGPDSIGTVRNVKLYRKGKEVSSFDLYKFLISGEFDTNLTLEDNDVVSVAPYFAVVTISGAVKRPMRYEVKEGETLADLLEFAGGFSSNSYPEDIFVARNKVEAGEADDDEHFTRSSFVVGKSDFASFKLADGDSVVVRMGTDEYKNKVEVVGAVWQPGPYALSDEVKDVKSLIAVAGGLRPDAYLLRAHIKREGEDKAPQMVTMNLQNIILGNEVVPLQKNDTLRIYAAKELVDTASMMVLGEVRKPGNYMYRAGMTIGDAVLMAGGLTEAATLEKVEVARRVHSERESNNLKDTIAIILKYNLLENPADANAKLSPEDIVYVRKSIQYKVQERIKIEGEVLYPGEYVVEKNVVRLSDVVKRASGFTPDAYVGGAILTRYLTDVEYKQIAVAKEIAKKQLKDTIAMKKLDSTAIGDHYMIAINLDLAVANPGSYHDVVLRSGDVITVPKLRTTVKVSGNVFAPNYITYKPGEKYKYYLKLAGGFDKRSMRGSVYMVHMNGYVARKGSKEFKVKPGTEIVVPKRVVDSASKGQTLSAVLGIASSTASLAAMVVTIVNNSK